MKKQRDYHARLIIYGLDELTQTARRKLAIWLEQLSQGLLEDALNKKSGYAHMFTAKYMK